MLPDELVGRGNQAKAESERLYARAFVVDNGEEVLAFVITDNIGMFAKYQNGPGLIDIARSVAASDLSEGRIPANHVIAAGSHTHSGPDTLGAWGGVTPEYLQHIHDQAVGAVLDAYQSRRPAELVAGTADGRQKFQGSQGVYELVDNQVCARSCLRRPARSTPRTGARVPGITRNACETTGGVIASFVTYAAHPTLGGAGGLHGDWIEYLDESLEATYGGCRCRVAGHHRARPA